MTESSLLGDAQDSLSRLRAAGAQTLGIRIEAMIETWPGIRHTLTTRQVGGPGNTCVVVESFAHDIHRISGSAGTFGYPQVSTAAAPLEALLLGMAQSHIVTPDHLDQTQHLIERVHAAWLSGPTELPPVRARLREAQLAPEAGDLSIGVTADGATGAELVGIITLLGYKVVRLTPGRDYSGAGLAAAVVHEDMSDPLGACRRMQANCPVLLVTKETSFPHRLSAARAGVTAILGRPLDPDELADWLDELAGQIFEVPYSVLVVDDDVLLGEAYALALRRAGMHVTVIAQPDAAFATLSAAQYDLVLMDVQMPTVDGLELARVIRQTRRHLFLPVVFLSAEQNIDRKLAARRVGGDDFITKPVDLDHLVQVVRLRAERARTLRTVMERDGLTGLLNHSRFKDRLVRELERGDRTQRQLSLVLVDLDHFKNVNDSFGHLVGDRVIRALARTLVTGLRKSDVIGRYGGEEFIILLPDTSPAGAVSAVEKIRHRFEALQFDADQRPFSVTLSAGVAGNGRRMAVEALINAADRALYKAKRNGRNRIEIEDTHAPP